MSEVLSFLFLGVVEGLTEFIPVSSSGHLILVREFWGFMDGGLSADAVLQLAAVLALVVYFWKDILGLVYTALAWVTGRTTEATERNMLLAIIVGTVPAIIAGLYLESLMETTFRSAHLVAYALIVGSAVMLSAEYWASREVRSLTWWRGFVVGLFQCLALVPGMSRSGMTIAGGMFLGLTREQAARFGFLLSIPILAGSGLKKLYELYSVGFIDTAGVPLLVGFVAAFVSGLLAVHLLLLIVRKTPLTVFVVYRVALAVLILTLL